MKKLIFISILMILFFSCVNKKTPEESLLIQQQRDYVMERSNESEEDKSTSNTEDDILNDKIKCSIISQDFVKEKLLYPDEADFENYGYVHERDGNEAIILNQLTSKNGYGVEITYTYKIWLKFNGGDWEDKNNWTYSKLIIEGSDGTKEIF